MAKADFCFTYMDGDATRDMAHMNRLERGAYTDVIIQQRQRGHLALDDLKKFLSRDFEAVWPALEWILKKDSDGKFFIEWLEVSEIKAKSHSKKQSGNRMEREEKSTKPQPNGNQTSTKNESGSHLVPPLKDGDGDVNEDEKKNEPDDYDLFLERWTQDAIADTDEVLRLMEAKDAIETGMPWPPGFDRVSHILEHRDLARRYTWTFETQQKFRYSLLKVLRENKNKTSKIYGGNQKSNITGTEIIKPGKDFGISAGFRSH